MNRREFVSACVLASAGSAVSVSAVPGRWAAQPPGRGTSAKRDGILAGSKGDRDIRLGVCSYSFRDFQRNLAIKLIKSLDTPFVSVKEFHLPYASTADDLARAVGAFKKADLTIVSGGAMPLDSDDPRVLRRYFEYARSCGMPMIVSAPTTHEALPHVEKLAREFNIKVAVHNHGPEDKTFQAPLQVLDAVKDLDPLVGLCIDVGHSIRAGSDVVEAIALAGPRLLDIHMKDLRKADDKQSQCDVGKGVVPVPEIFKQLKKMQYPGYVNLEYEINSDNPIPGMMASLGFMRGVLAGLGSA
jgi:sugar phosphate isomerase/epimerase